MNTVVVTRHPALVEVLIENGLIDKDTPVISHATVDDVKGKDVIGVLPLFLAAEANSITEISLHLPVELRGKELTAQQIRSQMATITKYVVNRK